MEINYRNDKNGKLNLIKVKREVLSNLFTFSIESSPIIFKKLVSYGEHIFEMNLETLLVEATLIKFNKHMNSTLKYPFDTEMKEFFISIFYFP